MAVVIFFFIPFFRKLPKPTMDEKKSHESRKSHRASEPGIEERKSHDSRRGTRASARRSTRGSKEQEVVTIMSRYHQDFSKDENTLRGNSIMCKNSFEIIKKQFNGCSSIAGESQKNHQKRLNLPIIRHFTTHKAIIQ